MLFFMFLNLLLANNFISDREYARMLYENPRGISCAVCHGKQGKGRVIASYEEINKDKNSYEEVDLLAPKISGISKEKFYEALRNSKGFMPSYYLTAQELEALYRLMIYYDILNKEKLNDE